MIVKFATLCDVIVGVSERCNKRSPEYDTWPTCRVCQNDVCYRHSRFNTEKESDGKVTVICKNCSKTDDPLTEKRKTK